MKVVQAILPIGTVLNGQYILESLLGKGSFGNVYLVRDQRDTQKLFALAELINPKEQQRYRFTLDYVSYTPLRHQALPQAPSVFTDDTLGRTCLLVRYSEEPHLEILRLQQPEQRFPFPQVMTIMAPIIRAVSHLHQQHPPVLHQNIKPASIIVPRTAGEPVLALLRIMKKQGVRWSPVPYFAPGYGAIEQYREEFSTRTDIYGLGATYYLLLTGLVPPDALYRATQLDRTGIDLLKPVHEVVPAIPPFTANAIQQAMALEEDHRFSSVEQFWEALWSPIGRISLSRSQSGPPTSLPAPATPKPAVTRPATMAAPSPSQASRCWKRGFLWPFARMPRAETPAPVPQPWHSRRSWRRGLLICGFLALFTVLVVGVSFWPYATAGTPTHSVSRQSGQQGNASLLAHSQTATAIAKLTPRPTATATPHPGLYMAGTYNGSMFNQTTNQTTAITVLIVQKQGDGTLSGTVTFKSSPQGVYPLSGTDDTQGNFSFAVHLPTSTTPLLFIGTVQQGVYLHGNLCNSSSNVCSTYTGYFTVGPRF